MRVARLFLFADWPEKYFSGQSERENSNASGTGSVRVSAQGLSRSCWKLSPMKIPPSRPAAPGSPRMGKFQRFWKKQENQDGGSKMVAIVEPDVIVTSYDVTSLCCGPQRRQFWTYYLPSKFRCHSFNILGVKRWGPNESHWHQKTHKNPVWVGLSGLSC